ncbi:C40 family peptidase [Mariniflexile ostreae]|uniref:C40 family peptidase n=1 Tax=Mariniflexile ostreae TaxID=1520892 RepID=A0ABV5FC76_9FLAO
MQKFLVIFFLSISLILASCSTSKKTTYSKVIIDKRTHRDIHVPSIEHGTKRNELRNTTLNPNSIPKMSDAKYDIINYAKQFEGVKYKWGGTTPEGMDCSGLVFESFRAHDIFLPRISRDMAKRGEKILLKETLKGDLLFFKTQNRRNDINHVGLVVAIEDNAIKFIHSTTQSGVIISSLNEEYWKNAFTEVRRIL